MRADRTRSGEPPTGYRVVIVTLDAHAAGPAARACNRLCADFPGLALSVHAAAEWAENPAALAAARAAVAAGDIVIVTLLFLEEHVQAILPALVARAAGLRRDGGDRCRPGDRRPDADGRA